MNRAPAEDYPIRRVEDESNSLGVVWSSTDGTLNFHCNCGKILSTASIHNHFKSQAHVEECKEAETLIEEQATLELNLSETPLNLVLNEKIRILVDNDSLKVFFN